AGYGGKVLCADGLRRARVAHARRDCLPGADGIGGELEDHVHADHQNQHQRDRDHQLDERESSRVTSCGLRFASWVCHQSLLHHFNWMNVVYSVMSCTPPSNVVGFPLVSNAVGVLPMMNASAGPD